MQEDFKNIIRLINESSNFVITSHISPDGDNIGAIVAFCRFLKNINKNVVVVLDDDIPTELLFLTDIENIIKSKDFNFDENYVVISLDCADKNRISINEKILIESQYIINIDHHISNTLYGDINYVKPLCSSTCEVLLDLFKIYNESKIDDFIATALYTGISTDTGNFMFSSVDENTFLSVAYLTKKGANRDLIANEIYRSISLNQRILTSLVLETLEIRENIAIMLVSEEMLKKSDVKYEDTELITNIPIDTKGVKIGILIKEKEKNFYKISFRSKGNIDVCSIAQKFGGGGHKNAAGCTFLGNYSEIKEKLFAEARLELKKG